MNKELIKKYKAEFDHWLNGGKILYASYDLDEKNYSAWYELHHDCKWGYNNAYRFKFIINDAYVEFRKALAEGKIVEFKHPQVGYDEWEIVTPEHLFQSVVSGREYRIKPEEPKFKVGNWVVNKTSKQRIIKKVTSVYSDSVTVGDFTVGINVMLIKDLELWQPKIGEWCWFWNDSFDVPILAKLISIDSVFGRPLEYKVKTPSCISETSYNYMSNTSFKKCEPFIGQLPSILKA